MTTPDPFAALGLPARPDLSDEQVRAAWRTVAAATHPDRPGGGNPAVYAAASAAYATLRTPWGRSEAYADLMARPAAPARRRSRTGPPAPGARTARSLLLVPARIRHGRPLHLALRIVAAVLLASIAARSEAGGPAAAGVAAGLAVWLVLSGRGDPRRRDGEPLWPGMCAGWGAAGDSLPTLHGPGPSERAARPS